MREAAPEDRYSFRDITRIRRAWKSSVLQTHARWHPETEALT